MSNGTVPKAPELASNRPPRSSSLRPALFAIVLVLALGLVVWGVAGWSPELAKIIAGLGLAGLAALFLVEVS